VKNRSTFPMLAIALAVYCTFVGLSASAAAQSTCSTFGTVSIDSGAYIFQNNEWQWELEQHHQRCAHLVRGQRNDLQVVMGRSGQRGNAF
jgi:hypothetical protein